MDLIFRLPWNFDLYKVSNDYILTMVFSEYNNYCQMDVFRSFKLKGEFLSKAHSFYDFLTLADEIRSSYPNHFYTEVEPYLFISDKGVTPQHMKLSDFFIR